MSRSPQRLISLVLLLSLLTGLLSFGNQPSAAVAAPSSTSLVAAPRNPAPHLPTPAGATSTSLSSSFINTARAVHGSTHTANGALDGSYTQESLATHTYSGSVQATNLISTTAERYRAAEYTAPATLFTHDELTFDYEAKFTGRTSGGVKVYARLSFWDPYNNDWSSEYELADGTFSYTTGATELKENNVQVSLGMVPTRGAVRVRLRCLTGAWMSVIPTCEMRNLRFANQVPNWSRYGLFHEPNVVEQPSRRWKFQVSRIALGGKIPTRTDPFLSVKTDFTYDGSSSTTRFIYQSPTLRFPTLPSGTIITASVNYAYSFVPNGAKLPSDTEIKFAAIDGVGSTPILTTNAPITNTAQWQTKSITISTTTNQLSDKIGWIQIEKTVGQVEHVVALDNLRIYANGKPIPLPPDQLLGKCACDEAGRTQHIVGDPVNTYSGSYYLQTTDLTVPGNGPPLIFERTYTSLFAEPSRYPTTTLGPGWQHPFAETLVISKTGGLAVPGTEPNTIIYESASGNRLRFYVDINGKIDKSQTPHAAPGVRATLDNVFDPIRQQQVYRLRSSEQWIKLFDVTTGRLLERRTPGGNRQVLTYYQTPNEIQDGQLYQVVNLTPKDGPTATLRFTYGNVSGPRLTAVEQVPFSTTTQQKRVTFSYSPAGALVSVTDVHGGTTTYSYEEDSFRLKSITDPVSGLILTNSYTYDLPSKTWRITQQVDHTGITTSYSYVKDPSSGALTTTVQQKQGTTTLDVLEDHYRADRTLEYQIRNGKFQSYSTFDYRLAPAVRVDGRGNATKVVSTVAGMPQTITDALSQQTTVTYDQANRPLHIQSPNGTFASLVYNASGTLIRSTLQGQDSLHQTTIYTYTADNELAAERRPDGVVTTYDYNLLRQRVRATVNPQTNGYSASQPDKHLVTDYGYDSFGRLITTTVGLGTGLERTDTTTYNADDTIARTIQNYHDGVFASAQPDEDIITEYGYDLAGRQIFVKDVLGHYTVTIYNTKGQVAQEIRNCRTSGGVPVAANCAAFDPTFPDRNVATRYSYDGLGRTAFITETGILTGTFNVATRTFSAATERMTHIEYDQLSRPVTVTLNYQPGQPNYDPTQDTGNPQINLQELTYYDGAGNVIWQRDVFGRWTKTEYDALNRSVRTIANYENGNPTTIDPANTSWATSSDTDLITEQQYRPDGQLAQQITNRTTGTFSLTNPDRDRITAYQYDTLGRPTTAIQNVLVGSTRTDINRVSTTAYHPQTGQVLGQQDALGQWLRYRYDALSRVTETIENCRAANGSSHPTDCTHTAKPAERNVRSLTRYDGLGRVVETEDALGHVTHTAYDGLGRVVATKANYVENVAPDADTNVTTRSEYDALGRVVAVTDPTGAVKRNQYDALGRAVAVTDAAGRVTRNGYDATGTLRWTQRHDGQITVFKVDGLGRGVTTIANYHNGSVEVADDADRDVITTTTYDTAGRTIETTEPARQIAQSAPGRRTAFRYDLRDQLVQVIENYHPQCSTLPAEQQPCNVTTSYTYDRAGNRTTITDALNHTREMDYDAADRLIEERDALNRATGWEYNERDQPTRKLDPRGSAYDVNYTYDELGRRTGTSATQLDAPITEQYDVLGRRTQLQDGTGTTSFQYDHLSRVTSIQQPSGTVGYSYTARGQRSQLNYPSGATVAYTYTPDGQLDTVYEGATALAHYGYDGAGRLSYTTRANGTLTTYAYDGLDRLFDLTTRVQGELRSRYQYTVDRTGLRTALTETFQPTTSGQSVQIQSSVEASSVESSSVRSLHQIAFVPNRGQTDQRVAFVARHQGGALFLTPQGLTFSVPLDAQEQAKPVNSHADEARRQATPPQHTAVRVEWLRANPRPTLTTTTTLPGTVNDLRGNDPAAWRRNLPTYGSVTYTALYDGIDLRYDAVSSTIKGTYTVAPGANPAQIRWRYAGATAVQLTDTGDLQVRLAAPAKQDAPTLSESAPVAWQDGPSGRTPVTVAYNIAKDGTVGLTLGAYDPTRPLTIDPTLTWSTTLSGSGSEEGHGIAVAGDGTLVLTGATNSVNFPQSLGVQPVGHHGNFDAFVTKLSADGTQVLWQTFFGGSGSDWGSSLGLDAQGRPVIVGMTASDNLLTTSAAVQSSFGGGTCAGVSCFDAFIARLSADGSTLQYSSYLGGSHNDWAQRIALASDGSAVLVGETASSTFPTTAGAVQNAQGEATCASGSPCTDAFITRIDLGAATGAQALRWSTRFGGTNADSAWGVAVDSTGDVLVTGTTESANLPLANAYDPTFGGLSDAFVAKLSGDGTTLRWGTYLGSTKGDAGRDVAVDGAGDVYITGWTASPGFPTTPGSLQPGLAGASDAFVTKLSSDGTRLRWSTLVGGSDTEQSASLVVAADGTSTLVGSTSSVDVPTVRPLQTSHAGPSDGQDLLVATLKPDGSTAHLVSYLGSSSDDRAWDVAAAGSGSVRITGYTGATSFPDVSPPPGGTSNAFVLALDGLTTPGGEPAVEQRAVSYHYDPLHRLAEATETPGTSERYVYDLVGNRTQVWINGAPQPARTYDAANQVVGLSYDAAGNLLHDGTRTLTYDALSRLTSANASGTTTSYRYTGDGVLASQTASGTTTYTQDLAAPLSQVLEQRTGSATVTYRYGQERLTEVQGSTRTWYGTDALGSVRQTLTDGGSASAPIHYDAWGTPTQGTPQTFGFTGELQDSVTGLVHLRARWYLPGHGTFASRDPFAGFSTQPYSLHPYQYGYSNPVLYTDPSGLCPPTVDSHGCDTPVTLEGFGARMLGVIEQWNYDSTSHHAANRPSATIAVYRFLDRHADLAQRYDPRTDPSLRQDIQKYFRDRDYDETVAQLLGILGGWHIDNPPADASEGSSSWGALGMIAFALPFDLSDCLPYGGNHGSSPPANRSPQASFDDGVPSRSRLHHDEGPASSAAQGQRLKAQLKQDELESTFLPDGKLHPDTIRSAHRIMEGAELNNPAVIKELTRDGSNIRDWGKYSVGIDTPQGPAEVHFYYNPVTGTTGYIDYKSKAVKRR